MTTTLEVSTRRTLLSLTLAAAGLGLCLPSLAEEVDHSKMDHSQMDHSKMDHGAMDHSAHMAQAAAGSKTKRSEASYKLAAVPVTRQDGKSMSLASALNDGRPVVLNFIYTSCTAICPVTSQVFAELRDKLGEERDKINMISVSIDPEYDTPARLAQYAERFGATPKSWNFYTGTTNDSIAVQKSFATYQGDKMNHVPVTFLRSAPGKPWVRIDGFASPEVLLAEVRPLLNK
jgi:protein SCO1/2